MADMKAFLAKLNEDKAFAEEIAAVQSKEELLAKVKAAGFDVTEEDLAELDGEQFSGELSDDELDAVAGGGPFGNLRRPCENCGRMVFPPDTLCISCRNATRRRQSKYERRTR